jgi:D-arabinose 1-dehydrogenase-like Zn-dependent alcohol dehydrogenase
MLAATVTCCVVTLNRAVAYIRSKRSNAVYGAGGDTNYTISYNVRNGAVHTAVDTVEHAARRYTY